MGLRAQMAKVLAGVIYWRAQRWKKQGSRYQRAVLMKLVRQGRQTVFGTNHQFDQIKSIADFQSRVPVREYEELKEYIEQIRAGKPDVLWPGQPLYLSKTSGTTSGIKYIPITKASIRNQIQAARDALLFYIYHTGKAEFLEGKLMFLSGSPVLNEEEKIPTGRLSGIINHHIPSYLQRHQVPGYKANSLEDWELKVETILDETIDCDLRLISGIPPWVQMYFDRLYQRTGKPVAEVFPNFSLFVYGGVNYQPYQTQMESIMGKKIDSIETYPASEGFFAFQDEPGQPGLLLLIDAGIFYEFIPLSDLTLPSPRRLTLGQVRLHENYALVISTNAGLWGYLLGDTVKFISTEPYRILVTGRIKHFISAFGEHVIAEEVEGALREVASLHGASLVEFSVAPQVNPSGPGQLPYHEWFIEFGVYPHDLALFAQQLDETMQLKNPYYKDLVQGCILQPLKIKTVREHAFIDFMKNQGKLGGQNKVPHLSNTRVIAGQLEPFVELKRQIH